MRKKNKISEDFEWLSKSNTEILVVGPPKPINNPKNKFKLSIDNSEELDLWHLYSVDDNKSLDTLYRHVRLIHSIVHRKIKNGRDLHQQWVNGSKWILDDGDNRELNGVTLDPDFSVKDYVVDEFYDYGYTNVDGDIFDIMRYFVTYFDSSGVEHYVDVNL